MAVLLWIFNRQGEPRPEYFWRHYGFANVAVNLVATFGALALWSIVSSREPRKRAARIALLTGSLALIVAVGEAFTLFGHDYRATFGTWWHRTWLERAIASNLPDEELIHIHPPHLEVDTEVHGNLASLGIPDPPLHRVRVRYDHNGFRNATDLESADIVVIGDSFVEGALVPYDEIMTSRLAEDLGVTVANLGQAAYGPQQELIVLERYGLPLKPRVVVWCLFGGNDFQDVRIYEDALQNLDLLHAPARFVTRSLTRNALLKLARMTTPKPEARDDDAMSRHAWLPLADGTRELVYFAAETPVPSAHAEQVVTETLRTARQRVESAGGRFLVVYIPSKYDAYCRSIVPHNPREETMRRRSTICFTKTPLAFATAAIEDLETRCLCGPLHDQARAGRPPYFPDDTHWNAHGHATAARAIAAHLRQRGWLK